MTKIDMKGVIVLPIRCRHESGSLTFGDKYYELLDDNIERSAEEVLSVYLEKHPLGIAFFDYFDSDADEYRSFYHDSYDDTMEERTFGDRKQLITDTLEEYFGVSLKPSVNKLKDEIIEVLKSNRVGFYDISLEDGRYRVELESSCVSWVNGFDDFDYCEVDRGSLRELRAVLKKGISKAFSFDIYEKKGIALLVKID